MAARRTDAHAQSTLPGYTLCGEPAAEARVAQDLARLGTGIDSEVGDALLALVLTGPFARGEGGVVEIDGETCPAEPGYQLFALFKRNPGRRAHSLAMMAATWSRLLRARTAIHALGTDQIARVPASRFWFQAGLGATLTLVGDATLARKLPHFMPGALRECEPARALCAGLSALALASLDPASADSVQLRRIQHAVLACADALLLRRRQYTPSLHARTRALQSSQAGATLRAAYVEAIHFCERPDRWAPPLRSTLAYLESTRGWLASWFMDYEAVHSGTPRDALAYATDPQPLLEPWGLRPSGAWQAARALRHALPAVGDRFVPPLERLLRCSVALAFGAHLPACRALAARLLRFEQLATGNASNAELAGGLRALAERALHDPLGDPFADWAAD